MPRHSFTVMYVIMVKNSHTSFVTRLFLNLILIWFNFNLILKPTLCCTSTKLGMRVVIKRSHTNRRPTKCLVGHRVFYLSIYCRWSTVNISLKFWLRNQNDIEKKSYLQNQTMFHTFAHLKHRFHSEKMTHYVMSIKWISPIFFSSFVGRDVKPRNAAQPPLDKILHPFRKTSEFLRQSWHWWPASKLRI